VTDLKNLPQLQKILTQTFNIDTKFIKTSRQASRLYDDSKIDIWGVPLLIQVKNVKSSLNYTTIFNEMDECLKQNFPPNQLEHSYPKIIRHQRRRATRLQAYEDLIIMPYDDWLKLIAKAYKIND